MQIVIEIPDDLYEGIERRDGALETEYVCDELMKAVDNGTPLPKGHGRLIEDTPELERELWTYTRYTGIDEAPYESAVKVIDEAPTIMAACTLADADTETWNGYHGQVTAPKGTFKRIYADADGGDAE